MASLSHPQKVRRLYKTILRLHRGLPPAMRVLGDEYTKSEFRLHKDASPAYAGPFMTEWAGYALQLSKQLGIRGPRTARPLGENLGDHVDLFNEDQLTQLYQLYLEARGEGEEKR